MTELEKCVYAIIEIGDVVIKLADRVKELEEHNEKLIFIVDSLTEEAGISRTLH